MSGSIANFNTGLGKYDGTSIYGASIVQDISGIVGSSDLNLTSGYVLNSNSFTLPPASIHASGFTITGWFNTSNTTTQATLVDLSCTAPSAANIALYVSGGKLNGNYPGSANFAANGTISVGGWNFFSYTVCVSGVTQVCQSIYLNGTTSTASGGTYVAYTVGNMFIGYGAAPYTQYFNAKVDDFRYYGRVLSPMEIRVLHKYSYNNMYSTGNSTAIIPTIGSAPNYYSISTPVYGSFVPTSIGSCQFWYDAADPLGNGTFPSNGSNLGTWYDKSGYGRHASQFGAVGVYNSTGFNGFPTVYFNPSSPSNMVGYAWQYSSTWKDTFPASGFTIFYVFQPMTSTYSGSPNNGFWTVALLNPTFDYYCNSVNGSLFAYSSAINFHPNFISTPTILCSTFYNVNNNTSYMQWKNGGGGGGAPTLQGVTYQVNFMTTPFTGFYIGRRADMYTGMIGNISEVLFYNNTLANSTAGNTMRQQVEGYLAWKWGLQSKLPTDHPYYNIPPFSTTLSGNALSFTLSNTGTFSYMKVVRYLNGVTDAQFIASPAYTPTSLIPYITSNTLIPFGSSGYSWNDVCYNTLVASNYSYSFTPVIMGTYGTTSFAAPSSVSSIYVTNITTTNGDYGGNRYSPINVTSGNLLSGDGIVTGTSSTNGINYNVCALGTANMYSVPQVYNSQTYILTYNCFSPSIIYVLAVGGGGGSSSGTSGGAGGVVMLPILVNPVIGGKMNITIGVGGQGSYGYGVGSDGSNTIITGNGLSYMGVNMNTIIAGGGSGGGTTGVNINGGSGSGSQGGTPGSTNNANYNFANSGNTSYWITGGSGGAAGQYGNSDPTGPAPGANGIQCMLPGIADFSSVNYSSEPWYNYYWGGSGGASYVQGRNGGRGGGGGSSGSLSGVTGLGDTYGINPGYNGNPTIGGGVGGACTGGSAGAGGGYSTTVGNGAVGGSGIVVIAFPSGSANKTSLVPISNYNFSSPYIGLNSSTVILNSGTTVTGTTSTTLTGWTCSASSSYTSINLIDGSSNTFGYASTTVGYQNVFIAFASTAPTGCNAKLTQSITFSTAGNYSLIYYALISPLYTNIPTLTVTISTASGTAGNFYARQTWIAQRLNFTIPSPGSYPLTFTAQFGTTGTASGIGISYVLIV